MSDTPMTDDRIVYGTLSGDDSIGAPWVNAPFARQLERELNVANERIKRLEEAGDELIWAFCPASISMMTERESDALKLWNEAKEAKP